MQGKDTTTLERHQVGVRILTSPFAEKFTVRALERL